jgi:hypothetical protein
MPMQFGPSTQPRGRRALDHRLLRAPPRLARLGEARREDHRRTHPRAHAVVDRRRHRRGRHRQHREVDRATDLRERPPGLEAHDLRVPRVDREALDRWHRTVAGPRGQVSDHAPAELRRILGGADDRDRTRLEQRPQ